MIVSQLVCSESTTSLELPTTFIGIDIATEPKILKRSPHYGRVVKVSRGINAFVSQNKTTNAYQNMVRKALTEQGSDPVAFELQPRTWGVRVKDTPFVEHKGTLYLELLVMAGTIPDVTYYLDGNEIAKGDIIDLRESESKPSQGGLEKTVVVRTPKLSNILTIRANGKIYGQKMLPPHVKTLPEFTV